MVRIGCLAALLALACNSALQSGDGATDVTLSAQPARVSPGDSVTLVLRNGGTETVGYNLCTSGLERRGSTGWVAVQEDRMCTMELRMLEPGAEARYTLAVPVERPAGEYRYFTSAAPAGSEAPHTVYTEPVVVER